MSFLKVLGTLAGTAIGAAVGGPAGAKIGAAIGGAAGGAIGGKGKPAASSGGQPQQYIAPPKVDLKDLSSGGSAIAALQKRQGDTKVAKAAEIPDLKNGLLVDPWQPMKDWYSDLGGDASKIEIDETRMP
jgi:hypothetical protein